MYLGAETGRLFEQGFIFQYSKQPFLHIMAVSGGLAGRATGRSPGGRSKNYCNIFSFYYEIATCNVWYGASSYAITLRIFRNKRIQNK